MVHASDAAEHRPGSGHSGGQRRRDSALCPRDVPYVFQMPHAERPPAVSMPELRREPANVVPLFGQLLGREESSGAAGQSKIRTAP